MAFNGTSTYISVPHSSSLDFTGSYTLSAWVDPASLDLARPLFVRGDASADNIEAYVQYSDSFVVAHNRNNGGTFSYAQGWTNPPVGQWTLVTIVFSQGSVELYHDGVLVDSATGLAAPLATDKGWLIGTSPMFSSFPYDFFYGSMEEARMSSSARSADWINFEYENIAVTGNELAWGSEEATAGLDFSHLLIDPPAATAGQTVTLTAQFPLSAYGQTVTFTDETDSVTIGTAVADENGLATVAYLLPTDASLDVHTLRAAYGSSSVTAALAVSALSVSLFSVSLTPASTAAEVLGTGEVAIAAGTALVFNRSDDIAVPNTITGDGSLAQEGDGTLTLTATNDYTGGTTIDSGAIQLGDGTTDGSLLGDVLDNAWLVFANESALPFGGDISGDGGVYKTGSGTLTLTGTSTYTGGTTIDAGTLQLGDGTTDGSLVGDITDNAALVFANGSPLTFDGAIDGTGSLAKTGAGLLTLSGTDSHTGSTTAGGGGLLYILAAGSENVLEGTQLSFSLNMDDFSLVPAAMTFSLETTAPTPPTGLSFNSTTQYVTWTPGTNWGGHSATIKVTAANSTAHISATQVISIDVYDKDRPPTISSPSGNLQATENTPFTFNFYDPLNPLASDPDAADVRIVAAGRPLHTYLQHRER